MNIVPITCARILYVNTFYHLRAVFITHTPSLSRAHGLYHVYTVSITCTPSLSRAHRLYLVHTVSITCAQSLSRAHSLYHVHTVSITCSSPPLSIHHLQLFFATRLLSTRALVLCSDHNSQLLHGGATVSYNPFIQHQ